MTTLRNTADRHARGRNSRKRGAQDERDVARILGADRHWANSGGPEDCEHPDLAIQVRGGKAVVNEKLRDGMTQAKVAAVGVSKLPCVVLVDRKTSRVRRYIVFELETYADYHGYGPEAE